VAIEQYSEPEFDLEPGDIVVAPARADRRTKELVKRLCPGEIAIIDHTDLDRVSAEELAEAGVRVVVNVAPSASGRFPNTGPLELVRSGVCLIDAPGADLFNDVTDGELLTVTLVASAGTVTRRYAK